VAGVLAGLFNNTGSTAFVMLAPEDSGAFRYTLYLELPDFPAPPLPEQLAAELDTALSANFHYAYCRRLGQLAGARIVPVTGGAEAYLQACRSNGQRLGSIKPSWLQKTGGWSERFAAAGLLPDQTMRYIDEDHPD
jgi:hypothetical protein